MTLAYAIHRLDGVATPANAAYNASEVEYQLKSSGAKCLFTVKIPPTIKLPYTIS